MQTMNDAIEIEEPADTIEDELGLFKELLGEEPIENPVAKPVSKRPTVALSDMNHDEFRAYKAQKQAERRAKLKERESSGSVKFDAASAREALADAALLILATGGPGADAIMSYLGKVYHDQVGAPMTIRARARSGQIKPKLLHIARTVLI